jgi:fatty acid desaturase
MLATLTIKQEVCMLRPDPLNAPSAAGVTSAASPPITGDEFRKDERKTEATRLLPTELIADLSTMNDAKSVWAVFITLMPIALLAWLGASLWTWWAVIPIMFAMAIAQHAFFILAHDAAHYRLFSNRKINDVAGRALGAFAGISMCAYRVIHRLHHNHLYTKLDPDVALNGGYPRGKKYLLKKLAIDLTGLTAYKTYAYFFGRPAKNDDNDNAMRPLDDTSPKLKHDADIDRWVVGGTQIGLPIIIALVFGWAGLMKYIVLWVLPMVTVLQAILRVRAISEHGAPSGFDSPLNAARTNQPGFLARLILFPHHVNFHIEHHLFPAVPHYNLPQLHRELAQRMLLQHAEIRAFSDTWKRVFASRAVATR